MLWFKVRPDTSNEELIEYSVSTVVEDKVIGHQPNFQLLRNFPNPFNPTTVLTFELPVASMVKLEVFDIHGSRVVGGLIPTRYNPGAHSITFDGTGLSSGIYFARLTAGDFQQTQKLVLMK